jgi:hypothetical protein
MSAPFNPIVTVLNDLIVLAQQPQQDGTMVDVIQLNIPVYGFTDQVSNMHWSTGETSNSITPTDNATYIATMEIRGHATLADGNYRANIEYGEGEEVVIDPVTGQPVSTGSSGTVNMELYLAGLNSELNMTVQPIFEDIPDIDTAMPTNLPQISVTLTEGQRLELSTLLSVKLAEDQHIDQAASTLTDEVYESSVTGYSVDASKMPSLIAAGLEATDLVHPTTQVDDAPRSTGEAADAGDKWHVRPAAESIAKSFVCDLVYQAFGFRFIEDEIQNETALVTEINDYLTDGSGIDSSIQGKLTSVNSVTLATAPSGEDYNMGRDAFLSLVKSICVDNVASAAANKRLTNDDTSGMFRNANKKAGTNNEYYIEFQTGDSLLFKLTLNPASSTLANPVFEGSDSYQHPKSCLIKLEM